MTLFAGEPILMLARGLMPGLCEVLVAATASSAMNDQDAVPGSGEIGDGFPGLIVKGQCAHGDFQNHVLAGIARAVGAFAVTAAIGFEFAVVAIAKKGVVIEVGFEVDAAAIAAVAAGGAAARNVFFAAESHAAIAAVAGLQEYFGFINEHENKTPEKR